MTNRLSLAPTLLNQPASQSWTQARVQDQVLDGYTFSTTTTFPGMSVGGAVRLNSGTAASITQMAVSKLASASVGNGTNRVDDLAVLGMGDWVTLREQGAPSNYMRFRVTGAVTDDGNYMVIPVSVYDPTGGAYTYMPYVNGAAVFLGREAGAPTNGSTTQYWRGDGTFAAPTASAVGVLRDTSGIPSSGTGVDGDFAVDAAFGSLGRLYYKTGGAWRREGHLNRDGQALITAGWTAFGGSGFKAPDITAAAWQKVGLAAQTGRQINFAGSTASANAALTGPYAFQSFNAFWSLMVMPVGATMYFGVGMYYGASWPMVGVSPAGVMTLCDGFGNILKTFSGTATAGWAFNMSSMPGHSVVSVVNASAAVQDFALFAPPFASGAFYGPYGSTAFVGAGGTLTAGRVDFTAGSSGIEVIL